MNPKRMKLLIVDDDESVHRALRLSLRREPYELVSAYDAGEAWHLLEHHPDIAAVISDHNMPGMLGVELLACIHEKRPDLPTLLLTAEATVDLACKAVNGGGVQGLLTKPWAPAELRAQLRAVLHLDTPVEEAVQRAAERRTEALEQEIEPTRDPLTGAFVID